MLVLPPACDTNVLAVAVNTAYDFGIMSTAAAGNEAKKSAVLVPACATRAVAVGAVYSTTAPSVRYDVCSDTNLVPDKVCCFSNRCAQQRLQAAAWTCVRPSRGMQHAHTPYASSLSARSQLATASPACTLQARHATVSKTRLYDAAVAAVHQRLPSWLLGTP